MELGKFGELLDEELDRREEAGRDLSTLAVGASFEHWLNFEARLVLEKNRSAPSIRESWWTANEEQKVDLGVWSPPDELQVAIELKLVHNNKNWKAQVDRAWADLLPAAGTPKARLRPAVRAVVLGVVGKTYLPEFARFYPGQRANLEDWEKALWAYAVPPEDDPAYGSKVERAWSGRRHALRSKELLPDAGSFFQLNLLQEA